MNEDEDELPEFPTSIKYVDNLQELSEVVSTLMDKALLTQDIDRILVLLDYQGRIQAMRAQVSETVGREVKLRELAMTQVASPVHEEPTSEEEEEEETIFLRDLYSAPPHHPHFCAMHGPNSSHDSASCRELALARSALAFSAERGQLQHPTACSDPRSEPVTSSPLTAESVIPELSPHRHRPHRRITKVKKAGKAAAILLTAPIWLPFAVVTGGLGWKPPAPSFDE